MKASIVPNIIISLGSHTLLKRFIQLESEVHAYSFLENYKIVWKHIVGTSNPVFQDGQGWMIEITGPRAISLCSMREQERNGRYVEDPF